MKVARLYTLDSDLINQLSNVDNASLLINQLLTNHFNELDSNDIEFLTKKKLEHEEKREIIDKKLEHLTNRLILLTHNKQRNKETEEFKEAKRDYKKEADALRDKWIAGEFDTGIIGEDGKDTGDQEYERLLLELRKIKPDSTSFVNESEQVSNIN